MSDRIYRRNVAWLRGRGMSPAEFSNSELYDDGHDDEDEVNEGPDDTGRYRVELSDGGEDRITVWWSNHPDHECFVWTWDDLPGDVETEWDGGHRIVEYLPPKEGERTTSWRIEFGGVVVANGPIGAPLDGPVVDDLPHEHALEVLRLYAVDRVRFIPKDERPTTVRIFVHDDSLEDGSTTSDLIEFNTEEVTA